MKSTLDSAIIKKIAVKGFTNIAIDTEGETNKVTYYRRKGNEKMQCLRIIWPRDSFVLFYGSEMEIEELKYIMMVMMDSEIQRVAFSRVTFTEEFLRAVNLGDDNKRYEKLKYVCVFYDHKNNIDNDQVCNIKEFFMSLSIDRKKGFLSSYSNKSTSASESSGSAQTSHSEKANKEVVQNPSISNESEICLCKEAEDIIEKYLRGQTNVLFGDFYY